MEYDYLVLRARDFTSGNFTFDTTITNIVGYDILSISAPYVWNTIMTDINDKIYFNISSTDYTATISQSNYSTSALATEIQTKMNAQFAGFTVTVDTTQKTFTISHSSSFSLTFSTNTTNSIASTIGFSNSDTSAATSQASDQVYNLAFSNKIYLASNDLSGTNRYNVNNLTKRIIFILNMSQTYGSWSTASNQYERQYHVKFGTHKAWKTINIKWYFPDLNKEVPFKGLDWQIILRLYRNPPHKSFSFTKK
jgi:hypothetical protein